MATSMPRNLLLPELPGPRPVAEKWKCQQSGDCCTKPADVVMTREERLAILPRILDGIRTSWRDLDNGMVALKAAPCPLYLFKECTVYDVRPYNCRRFACMRPDPKTEPWEQDRHGNCVNALSRILHSRVARRLQERIQRKAQRWADAHGWKRA